MNFPRFGKCRGERRWPVRGEENGLRIPPALICAGARDAKEAPIRRPKINKRNDQRTVSAKVRSKSLVPRISFQFSCVIDVQTKEQRGEEYS